MDESFAESISQTGPHAFPFVIEREGACCTGMTLRDYFAAKAMAAYIVSKDAYDRPTREDPHPRAMDIPEQSYKMADAMLKARQA